MALSWGVLMLLGLAFFGALYALALLLAANEIRAVIEFLPRPMSLADIFRHSSILS
jgi:hypothetical protein